MAIKNQSDNLALEPWMPSAWPLFWRRAFLLTLPISGPIWLVCVFLGCLGFMVLFAGVIVPVTFFLWLKEKLWDVPK